MALDFPRIYLSNYRIPTEELFPLELKIPNLTYSIHEAQVILSLVPTKERAKHELRKEKLFTEDVVEQVPVDVGAKGRRTKDQERLRSKRRKVESSEAGSREVITIDSSTESDTEADTGGEVSSRIATSGEGAQSAAGNNELSSELALELAKRQDEIDWEDTIKVLKISWFEDSMKAGRLLPIRPYLIYEGRVISSLPSKPSKTKISKALYIDKSHITKTTRSTSNKRTQQYLTHPTKLLQESTSEHENVANLPDLPEWLRSNFSCERPTPLYTPNDSFLGQLKKLKHTRLLENNDDGVRAYCSAIASIAAYPYTITTATEVRRLPGCKAKIAALFQEWKEYGRIREVDDNDSDPKLAVLNEFWNIWGIGSKKAVDFYNKGYRSLDDLVEREWNSLARVQQIGLKYYDDFLKKISRQEVEAIGATILKHARRLNRGFEGVIVGGYRRGKPECSDVDVILTHREEDATSHFLSGLVARLGDHGWITSVLIESEKNSNRDQEPLSWKGAGQIAGSGFDTLDKALVVWHDRDWPTKREDLARDPNMKNPNPHRRVDIIMTPWKTAGCAIIGWTGGTTFQRDLRLYCRTKGLKFDSSGIRRKSDGVWMDFEKGDGGLLVKEKRVFEKLGLTWREPTERCTG